MTSSLIADLPRVDEHATDIAAGVEEVWPILLDNVDGAFAGTGMALYARVVGSPDWAASGPRPLAEGSTVPGFQVVTVVPEAELVLAGRHRFASYALIFRLEETAAGGSRLRAETRAVFPGFAGGLYRLLVIGTGGHVVAVRRMLAGIRRRCEALR
jgi:hypothetical protein